MSAGGFRFRARLRHAQEVKQYPYSLPALVLCALLGALCLHSGASAQEQTVLGPGMYVFQTRTRSATCDDDPHTGYVSTFMAPIHGVPGERTMRMTLSNSEFWPTWTIVVDPDGHVVGDATIAGGTGPNAPTNHFSVAWSRDRFVGTGARRYRGGGRWCEVRYDALLRRIDL